jgi:hypothetical protein
MASQDGGVPPNFTYAPSGPGIDPNARVNLIDTMENISVTVSEHSKQLCDHEGQLKSFSTVVSSVQSTLSAWIMVAGVIAAFAAAAVALEIANGQKLDGTATKAEVAQLASRVDELGHSLKALPDVLLERLKRRR